MTFVFLLKRRSPCQFYKRSRTGGARSVWFAGDVHFALTQAESRVPAVKIKVQEIAGLACDWHWSCAFVRPPVSSEHTSNNQIFVIPKEDFRAVRWPALRGNKHYQLRSRTPKPSGRNFRSLTNRTADLGALFINCLSEREPAVHY